MYYVLLVLSTEQLIELKTYKFYLDQIRCYYIAKIFLSQVIDWSDHDL